MKKLLIALTLFASTAFGLTEVTDATFEKEVGAPVKAGKVVVVKFYATWCGPCKAYTPTFKSFASDNEKKAVFVEIDVDKAPGASAPIKSIPTTIFIKGSKGYVYTGKLSEEQLKEALEKVLKSK